MCHFVGSCTTCVSNAIHSFCCWFCFMLSLSPVCASTSCLLQERLEMQSQHHEKMADILQQEITKKEQECEKLKLAMEMNAREVCLVYQIELVLCLYS